MSVIVRLQAVKPNYKTRHLFAYETFRFALDAIVVRIDSYRQVSNIRRTLVGIFILYLNTWLQ